MQKKLFISIAVGVAVFFAAMLRVHLTDAEWVVSPAQLAAAAKKGAYVTSANGGITGRPIRKSNARFFKYQWITMGATAAFACFVVLGKGSFNLKLTHFKWMRRKFYFSHSSYPEFIDTPSARAKDLLKDALKRHAAFGNKLITKSTKSRYAEIMIFLVICQIFFGFLWGALVFSAAYFGLMNLRVFGQIVPRKIRSDLKKISP